MNFNDLIAKSVIQIKESNEFFGALYVKSVGLFLIINPFYQAQMVGYQTIYTTHMLLTLFIRY